MGKLYKDLRAEYAEQFRYGSKESPDYQEYIPPIYSILDMYFESEPGTNDAVRLAKAAKETVWQMTEIKDDPTRPPALDEPCEERDNRGPPPI